MLLLRLFQLLVLGCALSALANWRRGCLLLILVAALQDPVRKLTPGAPAYLVLSTFPIWVAIVLGAWSHEPTIWDRFRRWYPYLASTILVFVVMLGPAAVRSATFGRGSWQLTVIGALSYSSALFGVLLGFVYPRGGRSMNRVFAFYCIVNGILLVGGPMEYLRVAPGWAALGTKALMGTDWIRYHQHRVIRMIAGFYRSPDVMGWHAVAVVMLSVSLALISRRGRRYFWLFMAAWAGLSVMLCGRRKMAFMLPVFVFTLVCVHGRDRIGPRFSRLLGALAFVTFVGYIIYVQVGRTESLEEYYFSHYGDVYQRIAGQGVGALLVTYNQSGFLGEGLGTATLGKQHLHVKKPRTWQEGGLSRLLVELGVPGLLAALLMAYAVLRSLFRLIARYGPQRAHFPLFAGLIAILFANMASFIVSHQIFGDPFVSVFLAFLAGTVLAGRRLLAEATAQEPIVAEAPPGRQAPVRVATRTVQRGSAPGW